MIRTDLLYLIGFLVLCFSQSIFINGVKASMDEGMILSGFRKWIMAKNEFLGKPLGGCIKCMSSLFGGISYWPVVVFLFGFKWVEIPVFVANVFCLVYINFYLYKKI